MSALNMLIVTVAVSEVDEIETVAHGYAEQDPLASVPAANVMFAFCTVDVALT